MAKKRKTLILALALTALLLLQALPVRAAGGWPAGPEATAGPETTPVPDDPTAPEPTPSQGDTSAPEPTPSQDDPPAATAVPLPGKVVFVGRAELTVMLGETDVDFAYRLSAYDENGAPVKIALFYDDDFDVNVVGTYQVLLFAEHPVTGDRSYFVREVSVVSPDAPDPESAPQPVPTPRPRGRYDSYMRYRRQTEREIKKHMSSLTDALRLRVERLGALLSPSGKYHIIVPDDLSMDDADFAPDEAQVNSTDFEAAAGGLGKEIAIKELEATNWSDMLAVYVSSEADITALDPLDLINLKKISYDGIENVFWDMQELTFYEAVSGTVWIYVRGLGFEDMAEKYAMDASRRLVLDELMQPEFQGVFAAITGDTAFVELDRAALDELRASLPDNLSVGREKVVLSAYSLVGRVSYFWGGKCTEPGWNNEWGLPRTVTSENSPSTGYIRPYGLDCSGFVAWAFTDATGDNEAADAVGLGTADQWAKSGPVEWWEAQPGDLVFYRSPGAGRSNHVGIIVECGADGIYKVAHCSPSEDGVAVTSTEGSSFRYIRRPYIYGE